LWESHPERERKELEHFQEAWSFAKTLLPLQSFLL
jgi:hypothetical protein